MDIQYLYAGYATFNVGYTTFIGCIYNIFRTTFKVVYSIQNVLRKIFKITFEKMTLINLVVYHNGSYKRPPCLQISLNNFPDN